MKRWDVDPEYKKYVVGLGALTFEEALAEMVRVAAALVEASKLNIPGGYHKDFTEQVRRMEAVAFLVSDSARNIKKRERVQ